MRIWTIASLAAMLLAPSLARADFAVVVNAANTETLMTKQQVSDLYLGRTRTFPNGEQALVFDLGGNTPLREQFYAMLTGMPMQRVDAYWARLQYTGRVIPPQPVPDERALIESIRRTPGAIGYIRVTEMNPGVRAVLILRE